MTTCAVLDGSMALAWVLPGEADEGGDEVLANVARLGASVPSLWWLEIANVLLQAERRRRISRDQRRDHLAFFRDLPVTVHGELTLEVWTETLLLAERHGLSSTMPAISSLPFGSRFRLRPATSSSSARPS